MGASIGHGHDYNSSPSQCADLGYLEIQPQAGDLRFTQETHAPSASLDGSQPSPLLNVFQSTGSHAGGPYGHEETNGLYHPHGSLYGVEVRPRLSYNSTAAAGIAHAQTHAQRTGPLQLGSNLGALEHYSTSTRPYRRGSEHLPRSPAFHGGPLRRHQLTQGTANGFSPAAAGRMDSGQYAGRAGQVTVPPLQPVQTLGTLAYLDNAMTPVKVDISGTVDKGPFLSCDQEWTCYRRNYLACVCSFTLSPCFPSVPVQFTPATGANSGVAAQTFQVYGYAMCISAVVSENGQQSIELVQHTPKRDKGPITKPVKVPMVPKTSSAPHHGMGAYGGCAGGGGRALYPDGLGGSHKEQAEGPKTEHTFERIQFKHATLNNGKRRAAQQYYHLIVELWADVGAQSAEQYVKVAFRKSAKMIVRGRSPGHYQNERRSSQGHGPGGSAGSMSGYAGMGHMTADLSSNYSAMLSGGAGTGGFATTPAAYDSRAGSIYGGNGGGRQHELADEPMMGAGGADDDGGGGGSGSGSGKTLETPKGYHHHHYYAGALYDGPAEQHQHHQHQHHQYHQHHQHHQLQLQLQHPAHHQPPRIDMFSQRSSGPDAAAEGKVKSEYELGLMSRPFTSAAAHRVAEPRQHEHLDGKATSGGYYPSIVSSNGIHMTMA